MKIICFFSFEQARVSCSWEETWNVQKTISSFGKQVTVTHWRAKTSDCYVSPQMKPSNTTNTRESWVLSTTTTKLFINTKAILTETFIQNLHNLLSFLSTNFIHYSIFFIYSLQMAKNVAESPLERNNLASLDNKLAMAKRCSHGIFALLLL